jgi:multiple sugar transport system permease protein
MSSASPGLPADRTPEKTGTIERPTRVAPATDPSTIEPSTIEPPPPTPAAAQRRRPKRHQHNLAGYAFLAPWIIGITGFTLIPMGYSLYLSLTNFNLLSAPRWIGFGNYTSLWHDPNFIQSVKVTLEYVFFSVPLKLAAALIIAAALNRGIRGLGFYRSVYYVPALLGTSVAVALMWKQIFSQQGLLNQLLNVFGIHGPDWIGDPRFALWTLILLNVWQLGTPMLIFLAGLKQVPRDLYEAAAIDGAGRIRMLLRITLPMISPMVFFNLVLETINAFQAFTPAYVIGNGKGDPINSTLFYTLYLYNEGFGSLRMGYASAMAWLLFLVIGLFTALYFWTSRRWVTYAS